MRFHIRHESLYRYDVSVALGEHVLRLTPRADGIRLHSHRLSVEPEPNRWSRELDARGNALTRVSFLGSTQSFRVDSEIDLETLLPVPLGFGLPPLPWPRAAGSLNGGIIESSVQAFAEALAREVEYQPIAFLDHLTRTLSTRGHIRPTGAAHSAAETLALGHGTCRDLTVLLLEACRHWGIEGRFVSGYHAQPNTPDSQHHLHAWGELRLLGVGWRGWDASDGLRVDEGYVALCAAPAQAATMPIEGGFSFQGAVVNSTLDHSVRIRTT